MAALLVVTYLAFLRMNNDVRRARMFIMADRIRRFLGAFTLGFVAIALEVSTGILGFQLPPFAAAAVVFLFLGAIVFGSLQLFLVVRPPRRSINPSRNAKPGIPRGDSTGTDLTGDSTDGGTDAAR